MISGYVGLMRQGKTMLAVRDARLLAVKRGAILASNITIEPPAGVDFVRLAVGDDGLEGIPELLSAAHGERRAVVIMADELGIITPARFWQSGLSIDLMWALSQSGKMGGDLIFTAQSVNQVDAFLRRLTDHVVRVRAYPTPTIDRFLAGKRPWFFIASRFLPEDADGLSAEKRLGRSFIRYRRSWESTYDTLELVRPPRHLAGRRPRGPRRAAGEPAGEPGTPQGPAGVGSSRLPASPAPTVPA